MDLFSQPAPAPTAALGSPEALTKLRAHVWTETPQHQKGNIKSQDCLQIGGSWPRLDSLTSEQLLQQLRPHLRAEYTHPTR